MSILKNFAQNLKNIRINKKYSRKELADKLGLRPQTISKYENAQAFPSTDSSDKIMDILSVTPIDLFGNPDSKEVQILQLIKIEESYHVAIKSFDDSNLSPEQKTHEMKQLRLKLILDYINDEERTDKDLEEIWKAIFEQKLSNVVQKTFHFQ